MGIGYRNRSNGQSCAMDFAEMFTSSASWRKCGQIELLLLSSWIYKIK